MMLSTHKFNAEEQGQEDRGELGNLFQVAEHAGR